MAWRPARYLIEGELDNTERRRVIGWMRFYGVRGPVSVDLQGEFHRDIRGTKLRMYGDLTQPTDMEEAAEYMRSFATHQTGNVGDITAGLPPRDYVSYPYVEWYSDQNGRVVLDISPEQIEVVGRAIPACESDPISRHEQKRNMAEYLSRMCRELASRPPYSDPPAEHTGEEPGNE